VLKRKYKLILVAGARPNFMKIVPIIRSLKLKAESDPQISQIENIRLCIPGSIMIMRCRRRFLRILRFLSLTIF